MFEAITADELDMAAIVVARASIGARNSVELSRIAEKLANLADLYRDTPRDAQQG